MMTPDALPPVQIRFREDDRNPRHVRVSVFVGRDPDSLGHAGQLTFRTDEWDELAAALDPPVPKLRDAGA